MSYRLQVLIPEALDRRIRKEAQRRGISRGEWVRRAILQGLHHPGGGEPASDPLDRLAGLEAPTGSIDQMLSEIEAGRP